ncbi:MAG: hypothetical protein Q9174_003550 [Haloplaca sp. 1 TL-2023]
MSSTDPSSFPFGDRDRPSRKDERGNPFVSFSQYVDQQISSFFRNFPGFSAPPRASHEQAERDRAYEEWKQLKEAFEARERLAEETMGTSRDQRNFKTVNWLDSIGQRRDLANPLPSGPAGDPHRQDNDHDDYHNENEEELPLRCPYRPSREDSSAQDNSEDRMARDMTDVFPALLRAFRKLAAEENSNDPLAPVLGSKANPFPYDNEEEEIPGSEAHWDRFKRQYGARFCPKDNPLFTPPFAPEEPTATRQPENDAQEDAPHELACYQRMMEWESSNGNAASQQPSSGPPSIISTMTTTQRHTRPDGSIYTKIVLKKGFSDGREECTETEETTHGAPRRQIQHQAGPNVKKSTAALGYDGKVKQAIEERMREQKKGGWFWS